MQFSIFGSKVPVTNLWPNDIHGCSKLLIAYRPSQGKYLREGGGAVNWDFERKKEDYTSYLLPILLSIEEKKPVALQYKIWELFSLKTNIPTRDLWNDWANKTN